MSKETIKNPDNKDNKYRKNNEVQSTMVNTVMTSDIVDRGGVMLILILEKGETGKSSNLCSS